MKKLKRAKAYQTRLTWMSAAPSSRHHAGVCGRCGAHRDGHRQAFIFAAKPNPLADDAHWLRFGCHLDEAVMVGDRMDTDVDRFKKRHGTRPCAWGDDRETLKPYHWPTDGHAAGVRGNCERSGSE